MGRHRTAWFIIMILGFLCVPAATQGTKGLKVDYGQERPLVKNFEQAINEAIATTFPGAFCQVQVPKGVHLSGYGYIFMFTINLPRGMINSPFGAIPNEAAFTTEEKNRRIEGLKAKLVPLLYQHGSRLTSLQRNESVAICALFEETNPVNPDKNVNKTLILSILKSDLDELASKQERFNELRQRVKIVEY
jgi:hypothetical protein